VPARISVFNAWLDGWRRVFRAPVLVTGLLALTLIHSVLPYETHSVLRGFVSGVVDTEDADRTRADAQQLTAESYGLGWIALYSTFGFGRAGGVAASLVAILWYPMAPPMSPMPLPAALVGSLMGALVALFLAGGVLDRLARDRPVRSHGFFAACGAHFFRVLRLSVTLAPIYWMLLRWIYPWLLGPVFVRLASGSTPSAVEGIRLALYSVFTILLVVVSVIGDYALVRTVVEDRRSAVGSLAAAARFVRRRGLRVLALYLLSAVLPMAIFSALPRILPQLSPVTLEPEVLSIVVISIVLMIVNLSYLASAAAFFQGELAHAHYTAAPQPIWPESPAAEAIRNLTKVS